MELLFNSQIILLQIFLISFLLNVLWEVCHSLLYETCHKMKFADYPFLIVFQSIKDGFWITLFYSVSVLFFQNVAILGNTRQLLFFVGLALVFSFLIEKISLRLGRWKYTKSMPQVFGAGLTPFLELAITGIITFLLIFHFF